MILAIDTSTDQASVALVNGTELLAEVTWVAGGNHARHLDSALRYCLELQHSDPSQLTAIAVALGPGSFSGLRVGLSAAKGLALAREIPVAGVASLDIIALAALPAAEEVLSLMPAGRGQVFAALFENEHGFPRRVSDYMLVPAPDAGSLASERTLLAGPAAAEVAASTRSEGAGFRMLPRLGSVRRAAYLAELGRLKLERGERDPVADLEPLYLRKSSAEEKRGHRPEGNV